MLQIWYTFTINTFSEEKYRKIIPLRNVTIFVSNRQKCKPKADTSFETFVKQWWLNIKNIKKKKSYQGCKKTTLQNNLITFKYCHLNLLAKNMKLMWDAVWRMNDELLVEVSFLNKDKIKWPSEFYERNQKWWS